MRLQATLAVFRMGALTFHFVVSARFISQDLRRWFISMEIDLFRFRLQNESQAGLQDFFRDSKMDFKAVRVLAFQCRMNVS